MLQCPSSVSTWLYKKSWLKNKRKTTIAKVKGSNERSKNLRPRVRDGGFMVNCRNHSSLNRKGEGSITARQNLPRGNGQCYTQSVYCYVNKLNLNYIRNILQSIKICVVFTSIKNKISNVDIYESWIIFCAHLIFSKVIFVLF